MKKCLMMAAVLLGLVVMTGCAGNKPENPVATWQADRIFAEEITAKNTTADKLTLADVTYKSELSETQPALAAPINAFATIPATLYLKVVRSVDEMAATQDGRLIYMGVQNDIAAGADAKEILASMPAEDKAAYTAYANMVAKADQESIINDIVLPMIEQITAEGAKVAALITSVQENPALQALAGFELMKANAAIVADGKALGQQFSDATTGANLFLDLLKKDKEAKAFMQDYPVE